MFSSLFIIKVRKESAQITHLIDTKLHIHVSGKYFRIVSVTSSGVLDVAWILLESRADNSKQTRSTSASCLALRKWQAT